MNTKLILLFSGKRKSGKDYLTDLLHKLVGSESTEIIRISTPIKKFWAKEKHLDLNGLLGDGPYKEYYRKEMIVWSDDIRKTDYGFFCREAMLTSTKSIIIVSDIRRKTDIKWFIENFGSKVKSIRIVADNETRKGRGWIFEAGVDDVQSECDLDDYSDWNYVISNNNPNESGECLMDIIKLINTSIRD